jgi:hypothetical protein
VAKSQVKQTSVPEADTVTLPNLTAQPDNVEPNLSRADFGSEFPTHPNKGDMYLRVDVIPSVLFKWNGFKWIEISRASTDRYANNLDYIKFALSKIESGEYTLDMLAPNEQDQLEKYLNEYQPNQ